MTTGSVSPRRADTRRNHERILVAAGESLTRTGEVSFNAIAKQAEVGVGTVYRHFPTPEALILAVYQREVRHIVDIVPVLLEKHGPDEAFRVWVTDHLAHYMMTKKGLADALRRATASRGELPASAYEAMIGAMAALPKIFSMTTTPVRMPVESGPRIVTTGMRALRSAYEAMIGAMAALLKANAAAGTVRPDLDPVVVLRGLAGLLLLDPGGDWRGEAASLADLLWHGMAR